MNVSLVYPPFHLESLYSLPPLGLINLATGLGLAGHRPTIHDAVLELREGSLPMETLTNRILDDLTAACDPLEMEVTGAFAARGGITIDVTATYKK